MNPSRIIGQIARPLRLASLVALLVFALAPGFASAAETRADNEIVVGPEEVINDDLYVAGGNVTVLGTINGDLVVSGGNVTVSGPVQGDVLAVGGTTLIQGPVGRNVRALGGQITVANTVGQDVAVAGGTFTLGPGARVGRDLLAGTGNAMIDGTIARNVKVDSGSATLNGTVGGNLKFNGSALRLGPRATIGGNLTYTADNALIAAGGSPAPAVRGQVQEVPRTIPVEPTPVQRATSGVIGWARTVVGLFVLGLVLVVTFPSFSRRAVDTFTASALASLGIGLAAFLIVPIAAMLVFILGLLVGGWWLGLMLLAILGIALAAGVAVAALSVGTWLLDQTQRPGIHPAGALLLGVVVLVTVGLVPILGDIVAFLALLVGLGSLITTGYKLREKAPPVIAPSEATPAGPRLSAA